MLGREGEIKGLKGRVNFFIAIVSIVFALITGRLFFLQFVMGDTLRKYSEANRLKKEKLFAPRGIILDRNGDVVVDNRASFDVVLISQYYPFTESVNRRLAKVLDLSLEDLKRRLEKAKQTPVFYPTLIKADVSKDTIAAIEMDSEGLPGVNIEASVVRRYQYGKAAAQLLGYVGEVNQRDIEAYPKKELRPGDYIGRAGLERVYDSDVRGLDGVGYVQVDARGRRRAPEHGEELLGFVTHTEPVPGNNLYLTLDIDLQAAAERAMTSREFLGSVVALDPRNGEILAMANLPSYYPASISGKQISPKVWRELGSDKNRPLRNRAIQDHYPPGSTFKLIVAAAALAEGTANLQTGSECRGAIRMGRRTIHCWKAHGWVDMLKSIKESCDVFYYRLSQQLGVDLIAKYARMFGLGSQTGIRLLDEQSGIVPDKAWKKRRFKEPWQPGETLNIAIGQGFVATTPIQLAVAYGAIANLGFVYRPYIVKRIEGRGGEVIEEFRPELVRKVDIPPEIFKTLKKGLWRVVNEPRGTAYRSRSKIVEMSGKTGTSQVRRFRKIMSYKCSELDRKDRHHGLFWGYAPPEATEIVVVAVGEHACAGSKVAPVVRDVINAYFEKKKSLGNQEMVGASLEGMAHRVAGENLAQ